MHEESLRRNIIVAIDTGGGKTRIAIARAEAELEMCLPGNHVWFLAPTVDLCQQQSDAFEKHLPQYKSARLTGNDSVDKWNAIHWDATLKSNRIILSTYAILYDALCHGFVQISNLALIIFDEGLSRNERPLSEF